MMMSHLTITTSSNNPTVLTSLALVGTSTLWESCALRRGYSTSTAEARADQGLHQSSTKAAHAPSDSGFKREEDVLLPTPQHVREWELNQTHQGLLHNKILASPFSASSLSLRVWAIRPNLKTEEIEDMNQYYIEQTEQYEPYMDLELDMFIEECEYTLDNMEDAEYCSNW